jgi:hypothetical protein
MLGLRIIVMLMTPRLMTVGVAAFPPEEGGREESV